MRRYITILALALVGLSVASQVHAKKQRAKKKIPEKESSAQMEAAAQLQIFLDRSNFGPGKIDGQYNEFTWKALALFRESRGEPPPALPSKTKDTPPDLNGLDLNSVSVFNTYVVSGEDLQNAAKLPSSPKE